MLKLNFLDKDVVLKKTKYRSNNRIAFEIDTIDGEPFMVATVNVVHVFLKKDEVAIKNYSENEGIKELLIEKKIIGPELSIVQPGVTIHKCLI